MIAERENEKSRDVAGVAVARHVDSVDKVMVHCEFPNPCEGKWGLRVWKITVAFPGTSNFSLQPREKSPFASNLALDCG